MSDHAPLAPSSAARWVQCGRSPSLEAAFPEDEESEAAREGTAAHWYLSEYLSGQVHPEGTLAPNGVPISEEMIDNVQPLIADIRARMLPGHRLRLEERVNMTEIHPTDNWGTPDIVLISPELRTVYIWDFKYGHGFVDAVENWQLLDYAQGVNELKNLGPDWKFRLTIYQPRNYDKLGPLRAWEITATELAHYVGVLQRAAEKAGPDADAVTGPECKNCRGIPACTANSRMVSALADIAYQTTSEPLDDTAAGAELAMLTAAQERLKARITGLEEDVKARIKRGRSVRLWAMEQGFGREKWTVPVSEIVELGDVMGLDLRKPAEAITPAQARKKGLDVDVSKAYSETPKGEVKLVRATVSAAARAFSDG